MITIRRYKHTAYSTVWHDRSLEPAATSLLAQPGPLRLANGKLPSCGIAAPLSTPSPAVRPPPIFGRPLLPLEKLLQSLRSGVESELGQCRSSGVSCTALLLLQVASPSLVCLLIGKGVQHSSLHKLWSTRVDGWSSLPKLQHQAQQLTIAVQPCHQRTSCSCCWSSPLIKPLERSAVRCRQLSCPPINLLLSSPRRISTGPGGHSLHFAKSISHPIWSWDS